ncbi:LYR motif containing protein 1 isoform X1 [Misgurnus anguillicaudatus]|uniref:LYR motif containing protein 1 isoform X1 n=2 Tax=Misgurnus anguillicaudatus TaxID=75329 RepID=UPI003CCFC55D
MMDPCSHSVYAKFLLYHLNVLTEIETRPTRQHFSSLQLSNFGVKMSRADVLSIYRRVLRIARSWHAQSALAQDTEAERKYIIQEARTLFRQNQQITDPESVQRCIAECEARIEIGIHYRNPYPRPSYLPPMGLATQKGRKLRTQERLRKQAKPVYLQSHDET